MTGLALRSFQLKQFKAVHDSGAVRFTPLTVFIGNNGSGKSSLVEGLETFQAVVEHGLDRSMQPWRGFEHVWHQGAPHERQTGKQGRPYLSRPMSFALRGRTEGGPYSALMDISADHAVDEIFIQRERVVYRGQRVERGSDGLATSISGADQSSLSRADAGASVIFEPLAAFVSAWQFVALVPQEMGSPRPRTRTGGRIRLARDGSNVAEYLHDIRSIDLAVFDGIVETLQYVLPYARDVQPQLTTELERTIFLQLTEREFKVPGWLLSTGTLRILALLALFRHPEPPPLIVVEEIENGLDPRTIHLLVDEIRSLVQSGRSQVVITTHSPYLLDLLSLSQIIVVERIDGVPTFSRPADQASLQEWTTRFSPGQLYTMSRLRPHASS